ncbi:MAG: aminotransferase class I/II-fold pyridoxal phosphate-dependent enzyme [Microbacteriaceae bacterium]|nr:aminotransferase class I/II-fold pyridoxal phosphate-dependent enzyme [Microbacteriaceae bacterium]
MNDVPGAWRRAALGAGLLDAAGAPRLTIFAEMSALAAATGAVNLGQGFPDEDGPPEVLEAAHTAIDSGWNQYPPGIGAPVLREAIATHQQHWYGVAVDPTTEVLVTAGATEAIAASILALCEPGDEIVVAEPYYDSYGAIAALAGARLVTVPVAPPSFLPDPSALSAAVTDRTRLILVNSPHNPSGAVWPRELLTHVLELAHRHDAIIVTDEVYEHLVYEGRHIPLSSLPGGWERTVTISSGGKTFSVTGWKVGWAVGPAPLVRAITAVKQFLTFVNAGPFQPAIAAGLGLPDAVFTGATGVLREKRDLLSAGLAAAGFTVYRPSAGYFVVVDTAPIGEPDAAAFARRLPGLAGVVGIPVSALVSEAHRAEYASLLRFAFCKRVPVIEEAVARLAALGG